MCGIIGVFNQDNPKEKVLHGLKIIRNRGKDCFGVSDGKVTLTSKKIEDLNNYASSLPFLLGHNLHSIVGEVPQPLNGINSTLVANCEIYNWKELDQKYNFNSRNDAELLLNILDKKGIEGIEELDGVFAFAYLKQNKLYLARDIFGVKPLWLSKQNGLFFCSESKVLKHFKQSYIEELNPRTIMIYDVKKNNFEIIERKFFSTKPEIKKDYNTIKRELTGLIVNAVAKRIPDQKFAILFSGGVDSTIIALICKKLGVDFTCYTAAYTGGNIGYPEDLKWAKNIADKYGFELKVNELDLEQVENYLKKVVPLIENNNGVKASVALTFYAACDLARKDGARVIFSGLGSEELFAGYYRHKNSYDVNKECLSGLRIIYERDNYRDDVVTMNNNLELRVPFLDKDLAEYALKIPAKYKLNEKRDKIVLRDVAKDFGLKEDYAERPKKAAQYGSKFDKAIRKLAKKNGFELRTQYLRSLYPEANERVAVLFSSGKDSGLALHVMRKMNYDVECLITIKSENQDSWMFHTPNTDIAELQAEAMGLPIIVQTTEGEKEKELADLKKAIQKAKDKFHIEGVVTGALYSRYQRDRVEKICDELGLKSFSPLWHMNQEEEMRTLVNEGFEFIFSSVAADGLNKKWLGKVITNQDIDKLAELNKKNGINIAGEGGEFESLLLDSPEFKMKIIIEDGEIVEQDENTAKFIVKKAKLVRK
ncbi:diphthine--ammonia ligase [Candidatus Woesearchaeota archaeon]|nr:MAG: diphthine--ammonia ligase [Candidatus Woesearchaeota archaeon]